jgi:hypothetical protein
MFNLQLGTELLGVARGRDIRQSLSVLLAPPNHPHSDQIGPVMLSRKRHSTQPYEACLSQLAMFQAICDAWRSLNTSLRKKKAKRYTWRCLGPAVSSRLEIGTVAGLGG